MNFLSKIGVFEWVGIICILLCTVGFFTTKFKDSQQNYAVPFITTLGIFFTFFGVTMGLSELDEKNIINSLPKLLEGLKVAFLPSALAIFCALVFKLIFIWKKAKNNEEAVVDDDASIGDIISSLQSIERTLKKSLIGDGENSLAVLLTSIKSENSNFANANLKKMDELKKAQEQALLKISENSSKELVSALENVIIDFNDKISEQFGENFKQLNTAVGKLLVWQDKYKIHIETTEKTNSTISENMKIASNQYEKLVNDAGIFTKISKDLSNLLTALEEQKNVLNLELTALAQLVITASTGLPKIEENILSITNGLKNASLKNQEILAQSLNDNSAHIKRTLEEAKISLNTITSNLSSNISSMGNQLNELNREFNNQIKELSNKQFTALETELAAALTKSLSSLGSQLATLSNKFVSDYSPLTDRLQKIIEISKDNKF